MLPHYSDAHRSGYRSKEITEKAVNEINKPEP